MVNRKDSSQRNHDARPTAEPGPAPSQPYGREYQITIRGQLSDDWSDWFDGLHMTTSVEGNTVLSGPIVDQAALMGILNKLNRLNVTLLSLSPVDNIKEERRGEWKRSGRRN